MQKNNNPLPESVDKISLYFYKATVIRVIDGDTYVVDIDIGFNTRVRWSLRLEGIDTAETWRPKSIAEKEHGQAATEFVRDLIEDREVYIRTYKNPAVFSRYQAVVLIEQEDGSFINLTEALLEAGFEKRDSYE